MDIKRQIKKLIRIAVKTAPELADSDMNIIQQVEKLIEIELKTVPIEEIISNSENSIARNNIEQVVGLNLNKTKIKDISFLSGLGRLTHLSLIGNQISDLRPLSSLKNLTNLRLENNKIKNLKPLSPLTQLTTLYLRDNKITNIAPLSFLTNLTALYLENNNIDDLTPLSPLTNLAALFLRDNRIDDLTSLSPLTNLAALYLENNHCNKLSPLSPLTHLTTLNLRANNIDDLTPLSPLTNLTVLRLENNNINDLTPLSHLTQLTTLYLGDNKIADITPLNILPNLIALRLENNNIDDLTPLSPLTNLTVLRLENNNINDLTPLSHLTQLTTLYLIANNIDDLTPLSSLKNLTALRLENNNISDLTPLSHLTQLTTLYSGNNEIADIAPLNILPNLIALRLENNNISDLTPLSHLTHLTTIYLGNNDVKDLTPLSLLTNLIVLRLEHNNINDLTPLGRLTNLTALYLGFNNINDLTPLSPLADLTVLRLENNNIDDFTSLSPLTHLKTIYLESNKITDLKSLSPLKNLTTLYLGFNNVNDLTPLSPLTDLTVLRLGNNNINDLKPLSPLKNLTTLYLGFNNVNDLTPLSLLTQLTTLYLGNNKITDITHLRELKSLKILDVRNNNIERLPPQITEWWPDMEIKWEGYESKGLNLKDNPLTDPPVEIFKQGHDAVLNYFVEVEQASVPFLESKLLLVGNGDVGKTTIMKKLKDNSFQVKPGTEDTTRGINIQPWTLVCLFSDGKFREVNIHFWDFGGQEILHATHQFFLTKRSLYLFVWEARKEEIQSFDYWLNAVKLFGASSPVIVIMNKSEQRIKQIAESSLKEKFPNIAGFIQVSCVTDHHIQELTETIRTTLSQMQHLLGILPKRWMEIRDKLKAMNRNYISIEDYFAVCLTHEMNDEKALYLSDYLHDLGIVLHFRKDPLLADTVILKPEWATGAVYALIDSLDIQQRNGKFNRSELPNYWKSGTYPQDKYPHLLRLMEKFELCFNIVGTDDYIIPELLQAEQDDIDYKAYRSTGNLHLHYSYDFMPAGIVTRFMSRIHYLIHHGHYWKNGVELAFDKSLALVVSDPIQKRIKISVAGAAPIQLMAIIRSHFDHIHETLNMKKEESVFEEVPCICSKCITSDKPHFYKYKVLQVYLSRKKDACCDKSFEDVSTHQLLNGLLPPEKTEILFDTLITVASQVQGISKTLQPDENSRNTVVSLLLGTRGFRVKDQSLWGSSASGKGMGELDIRIENEKGRTVSIVEGLNLDYLNKSEIYYHVLKLLDNYNCNGLEEIYMLVYASASDFNLLCGKYKEYLLNMDYKSYKLNGAIEKTDMRMNNIVALRAYHKCNDGQTVLHHILVDMK